jgi:hypothetical protein
MISENTGNYLHDKATRGETISNEEQALLCEWYRIQDETESEQLGSVSVISDSGLQNLKTQIGTSRKELIAVTGRIQSIISENESLKREIAVLHSQFIRQFASRQI